MPPGPRLKILNYVAQSKAAQAQAQAAYEQQQAQSAGDEGTLGVA